MLGGADFAVVVMSVDRGGAKVAVPFLEKLGVRNLSTYLDQKWKLSRAVKVRGYPTTLLIDRNGREIGRVAGVAEWDAPESVAFLRQFTEPGGPEIIKTSN